MRNADDGQYLTNRRGVELCPDFNKYLDTCCETNKYGQCAKDASRVHQCSLCLSVDHGARNCSKPPLLANLKAREPANPVQSTSEAVPS